MQMHMAIVQETQVKNIPSLMFSNFHTVDDNEHSGFVQLYSMLKFLQLILPTIQGYCRGFNRSQQPGQNLPLNAAYFVQISLKWFKNNNNQVATYSSHM